ncbi:MAG TPA: hypothetical protein VF809_02155 [Candidatus Saccharimonadales bacterium]
MAETTIANGSGRSSLELLRSMREQRLASEPFIDDEPRPDRGRLWRYVTIGGMIVSTTTGLLVGGRFLYSPEADAAVSPPSTTRSAQRVGCTGYDSITATVLGVYRITPRLEQVENTTDATRLYTVARYGGRNGVKSTVASQGPRIDLGLKGITGTVEISTEYFTDEMPRRAEDFSDALDGGNPDVLVFRCPDLTALPSGAPRP